jgi:hypothetical protein
MKIKTKYLKDINKWDAYITFNGYDYYELEKTKNEAIYKLKKHLNA